MKKFGLLAVVLFAFSASAVFYGRIATDYGSKTIVNHSEGVVVYPYGKLKPASNATKAYLTTMAAYPTTFSVTDSSAFDGGNQTYNLVDSTTTGLTGHKFCSVNMTVAASQASAVIATATDGGFVIASAENLSAIVLPAFCFQQAGSAP